jgi:transcriptional regulator with XRE-family HTH domain
MRDLVGANVKRLRGERNLTQVGLAGRSGVHRLTILAIEKGRADNLGLDTLQKLADALGVAARDLLADAEATVRTARKPPKRAPRRRLPKTG